VTTCPAANLALTRAVRFSVGTAPASGGNDFHTTNDGRVAINGFGGWPRAESPSCFTEVQVTCIGPVDPATGYLASLADIEREVRAVAVPVIGEWLAGAIARAPQALKRITDGLKAHAALPVSRITWRLTPTYLLTMETTKMDRVLISQQFEFSAAHVLHVPSLTAEENRRIFGKCNNPRGHGHNYRIEVGAIVAVEASAKAPHFALGALERIVNDAILVRFDHKHLNIECPEFSALNPSVENITRVCHDLLVAPIQAAGARLSHVRVWETEKTSCTYPVAPVA